MNWLNLLHTIVFGHKQHQSTDQHIKLQKCVKVKQNTKWKQAEGYGKMCKHKIRTIKFLSCWNVSAQKLANTQMQLNNHSHWTKSTGQKFHAKVTKTLEVPVVRRSANRISRSSWQAGGRIRWWRSRRLQRKFINILPTFSFQNLRVFELFCVC